ncbi:splicing factor Cactin [Amia ocellicauda]|uniref:splicing factor Cactin n=1 Tax=Amia ocellicauda TaxID=2972642 RepID=UPI003464CA84
MASKMRRRSRSGSRTWARERYPSSRSSERKRGRSRSGSGRRDEGPSSGVGAARRTRSGSERCSSRSSSRSRSRSRSPQYRPASRSGSANSDGSKDSCGSEARGIKTKPTNRGEDKTVEKKKKKKKKKGGRRRESRSPSSSGSSAERGRRGVDSRERERRKRDGESRERKRKRDGENRERKRDGESRERERNRDGENRKRYGDRERRRDGESRDRERRRDGESSEREREERRPGQRSVERESHSSSSSERERERGRREMQSSRESKRENERSRMRSSDRDRERDSTSRERRNRERGKGSRERERDRGREVERPSRDRRSRVKEMSREREQGALGSPATCLSRSLSHSSVSSLSSPSPERRRGLSPGEEEEEDGVVAGGPQEQRDEARRQKELLKALETPEEKRARRLAKKEAKERKKREKMGWSEEYMGYTNADNPFGDNNLLGTFKWQKALQKKGIGHLGEKELKERNKRIQEENRRELQKVKQLRLEREREKAMRETELELLQREKEAEHFKTWAEQEDNFHLHQAKLRSKIRIRDGRAKPIDLLAKYISAEDDDLAVEMHEPYTFLTGLTVSDMDDLLEDIKVYMELEQGKNVDFWRDMTTITEDEISKLRKLEASGKGPGDRREGINVSVSSDVQCVFKGKTFSQLQALQLNMESKIAAGGSNLDIGYWESLLQQVRVYMARARLRERHQDVLRQKLYKLKQEQGVESEPLFPIAKQEPPSPQPVTGDDGAGAGEGGAAGVEDAAAASSSSTAGAAEGEGGEGGSGGEAVLTEEDLAQQSLAEYDSGRYSPRLLTPAELPLDTHTVDPEDDLQRLRLARTQLQVTGDASESAEDAFVRRAREGMGGDEAQFSVEMPLTGKMYLWADKYRPRKPRFFNRVHTGFEWNKYNQTHYDFDNPPPKIVQGYKFNIFYPDLIDKRSTPQYFLEPCADNKDFGVLRFHAGPPYEDIAFKIVNREWEYSHRHGFRCQFANGIFQLWFHFKRYRYRR